MPLSLSKPILYLITRGATTEATSANSPEFGQILNQIAEAVTAGIDLIQIREKHLTGRVLYELVSEAARLTGGNNTRLLVNDRADIACGAGADGVHLTAQSLDATTIRRTFGAEFLIGASTHSLEEATAAREGGADFVVIGPVFETSSKPGHGRPLGLETLAETSQRLAPFPLLALGGVSIENAQLCLGAGASGISGISLFADLDNVKIWSALTCQRFGLGKESGDKPPHSKKQR